MRLRWVLHPTCSPTRIWTRQTPAWKLSVPALIRTTTMPSTFSKITKWTHRTNSEYGTFFLCWISPSLLLFRSGSACSVLVRHFYDTRTQRTLVPLRPSLVFFSILNFYDRMLSWLLQLERSSNAERSRMIVTLTGMRVVASSSPNQYMLRAMKANFPSTNS
jgi:hypothetical protein